MKFGYMRVSTKNDQEFDSQAKALRDAGAEEIFSDRMSGAKGRGERPGLDRLLDKLRRGDEVMVFALDRFSRSLIDFEDLMSEFRERGIVFRAISQALVIDPEKDDPVSTMQRQMLACFAEFERSMIRARVRAGLEAAREQGKVGGRKRVMTISKVSLARAMLADGATVADVCRELRVSAATVYRWLPAAKSVAMGRVQADEERLATA